MLIMVNFGHHKLAQKNFLVYNIMGSTIIYGCNSSDVPEGGAKEGKTLTDIEEI